jgi:hypothetical protein
MRGHPRFETWARRTACGLFREGLLHTWIALQKDGTILMFPRFLRGRENSEYAKIQLYDNYYITGIHAFLSVLVVHWYSQEEE